MYNISFILKQINFQFLSRDSTTAQEKILVSRIAHVSPLRFPGITILSEKTTYKALQFLRLDSQNEDLKGSLK